MRKLLSFATVLLVSAIGAGIARADIHDVSMEVIPQWQTGQCPTTAKIVVSIDGDYHTHFYFSLLGDANVPTFVRRGTIEGDDESLADSFITETITDTVTIDPKDAGTHFIQAKVWTWGPSYAPTQGTGGLNSSDAIYSNKWMYVVNCTNPTKNAR